MLVTAIIAVAVGVASYAVVRSDPFAERSSALFTLDLSSLYEVDPNLIEFEQTAEIMVGLDEVRAISVGPEDKIYVAGERMIRVFSPEGRELAVIQTEGNPTCLAVGSVEHTSPGRVYVGAGKRIEVFTPHGESVGVWDVPVSDPILTSIAVAGSDVFVADAGNRVVLRYDESGELVGKIGAPVVDGDGRVFSVPSSYFDIAISSAGLVHVANPGVLRIETYTFDGEMEVRWGEAGSTIDDFFGCCNPSQFAVLPSGSIVTSEKGVPRVKVYSEFGEFECVVAGPQQLDVAEAELGDPRSVQAKAVFDVAADSQGRVLVLDPRKKSVRIFTRNSEVKVDSEAKVDSTESQPKESQPAESQPKESTK
jgi:hypothetical protein